MLIQTGRFIVFISIPDEELFSGTSLHNLSKLYDVPIGFVTPSSFMAVYCFICGCFSILDYLSCSLDFDKGILLNNAEPALPPTSKCFKRTTQIIRCRVTSTLRRPHINQDTCSRREHSGVLSYAVTLMTSHNITYFSM